MARLASPPARPPRSRYRVDPRSQEGGLIIEVIVASLLVGMLAIGIFSALDAASARTGAIKSRAIAANVAQADLERLRAMSITDVSNRRDNYVSTVGGIRVTEPGADLAIALAIASAFKNKALPGTTAAIGEISLAGEIRPASSAKQRVSEARRLGFSTILDAQAEHLHEALRLAFVGAKPDPVDVPEF